MGGGWWQNLAEASVNGRQVLVKRYEGREGKKVCISFAFAFDVAHSSLYSGKRMTSHS
jgi:hypothetical protein